LPELRSGTPAPSHAPTSATATAPRATATAAAPRLSPIDQLGAEAQSDAPACDVCGSITVRGGTCYKGLNCGNSMGCS
jgi:ribonucleoside-diphosphate reductase alpha chain